MKTDDPVAPTLRLSDKLAYSPKEAAQALSCSVSTIYELLACGRLRRVKIGRRTIIPKTSLEALIAESSSED